MEMKTKTVKRRAVSSCQTSRRAAVKRRGAGSAGACCAAAAVRAVRADRLDRADGADGAEGSSPRRARVVTTIAITATPAVTRTSRPGEYGSSRLPAVPAVIAKPAIIITQTQVAAAPRRSGRTRLASSTSREVPLALTPRPIIRKPSAARTSPAMRACAIQATAAAATRPPAASTAMPPMIQGVRRPPRSEPQPMRGRVACTA